MKNLILQQQTTKTQVDDGFDDSDDFDSDDSSTSFSPDDSTSRYTVDFKELRQLGAGGGGSVFKVRNRLDRRLYAVKKVKMRVEGGRFKDANKKRNARLRREVLSLSRLENRFCCRYYQAWVEGGSESSTEPSTIIASEHLYINESKSTGDGSDSEADR